MYLNSVPFSISSDIPFVLIPMANQDILLDLWIAQSQPLENVSLSQIGDFATLWSKSFRSRSKSGITRSGIDYAVLKFILEFCSPIDWPEGYWEVFNSAKDPWTGNYAIWRRDPYLTVNVKMMRGRKKTPTRREYFVDIVPFENAEESLDDTISLKIIQGLDNSKSHEAIKQLFRSNLSKLGYEITREITSEEKSKWMCFIYTRDFGVIIEHREPVPGC